MRSEGNKRKPTDSISSGINFMTLDFMILQPHGMGGNTIQKNADYYEHHDGMYLIEVTELKTGEVSYRYKRNELEWSDPKPLTLELKRRLEELVASDEMIKLTDPLI